MTLPAVVIRSGEGGVSRTGTIPTHVDEVESVG